MKTVELSARPVPGNELRVQARVELEPRGELELEGKPVLPAFGSSADRREDLANWIVENDGFARAIFPSHTMGDGDTIFALATAAKSGDADVSRIGSLAATARRLRTKELKKAIR